MVDYQVQSQIGAMMPNNGAAVGGLAANGYAYDFADEANWMAIANDVLAELQALRAEMSAAVAEMRRINEASDRTFWQEVRRIDGVIRGDDNFTGILGRLQKLEDNMVPKSAIESLQKDRDRHERSVVQLRATLFSMIGTGIVALLVAGAAHFLHW